MSKVVNDIDKLTLGEVKTVKGYLDWLAETKGVTTTKQAIHYQISEKNEADNIDHCEKDGMVFIIMNKKTKAYSPKESKRG